MDSKAGYPGLPPSGANEALPPYAPAATAPPYGQPYGGQPPVAGYSAQPGYVAPQYPMSGGPPQQPQVVMVGPGPQPQQTNIQLAQSFVAHIVFACVVFWCCNWLFGLIAFILATVASSSATSDPASARNFGKASIGVSVAGIIVTIIIVIIVVIVAVTSCPYCYNGRRYHHRDYVGPYDICIGKIVGNYCYY